MTERKIAIGIDPGVSTGFAVWDIRAKKFSLICTLDFWSTIDKIKEYHSHYGDNLLVVIENPNGNKPVFFKKGVKSNAMAIRVGQNVGSNKREASLLIEYCNINGISVKEVVPKGSKNKKGKVTKEYFAKISGYTERTSQHGRDAGMLVVGY
jgi:hypothetical protein